MSFSIFFLLCFCLSVIVSCPAEKEIVAHKKTFDEVWSVTVIEDLPGKVNLFAKNQLCDGRKERKLAIFGGAAVVGGQIGRKP